MIVLHEQLEIDRPAQEVFAYACEFAHCEQWDSTAIRSQKTTAGPTGVGTEYRVVCKLPVGRLTLRYRVLRWEPGERVVLEGDCPFFTVTDTITVESRAAGSHLDYRAAFRFKGPMVAWESAVRESLERMGKASMEGLLGALRDENPVPQPRAATRCGDRWVVPGVARFSRWGYTRSRGHWLPMSSSMVGRHVVLTGATSGIGLAAAVQLAAMGASLTLVARDAQRGREVVEGLRAQTGAADIRLEVADMSEMAQVRDLVQRLLAGDRTVDVLINNAGALFNSRQETSEGFEKSFALLLLGPYVLTEGLLPLIERSAGGRVINVVSGGMYTQRLKVGQLQGDTEPYSGSVAYARSKRALMVQTEEWAEAWRERGIVCNAMHPGWADTPGVKKSLPLFYRATRAILRTPEQGADTLVWLAAAREAGALTGQLFLDREPHSTHLLDSTREAPQERLRLTDMLAAAAQPYMARGES